MLKYVILGNSTFRSIEIKIPMRKIKLMMNSVILVAKNKSSIVFITVIQLKNICIFQ